MSKQQEEKKVEIITLPLKVGVHPERTLFLREQVADGEIAGKAFEISLNLGSGHFMCRIGKGRWYTLGPGDFVQAVMQHMEEEDAEG